MTKKALYHLLERMAAETPQFTREIAELVGLVQQAASEQVETEDFRAWMDTHPAMADVFRELLVRDEVPQDTPQFACRVFPVHKPFSKEISGRLELAKQNTHYSNWANAVKALPDYTLPLPVIDGAFVQRAKEIWQNNIYGNEAVLRTILRHGIEYGKTGRTTPLLLYGDPGIGKTLAAKLYGKILGLPSSFVSGPSASMGRGLAGAANLYSGAGAGVIVQAMIDHDAGNPVICIDEIDKASDGNSRFPDFQNSLLAALDDSNAAWLDNFLELEVDASHIPFVFTANERERISAPLLDRMDVVVMDAPTQEMLHSITQRFTLPRVLEAYASDWIEFHENEVELLVNQLWTCGQHSCRAYQKAVEYLVSNAYLKALENKCVVRITEQDVRCSVEMYSGGKRKKVIGFSS